MGAEASLYLRKVIHPQVHDNYRVILKLDEGELEAPGPHAPVGIDTVIPMRALEAQGGSRDRETA